MVVADKKRISLGHGTTLCGDAKALFPMQYIFDHIVLKVNAIVTEIDRRKDLFKLLIVGVVLKGVIGISPCEALQTGGCRE
jgi:hypothetical protein